MAPAPTAAVQPQAKPATTVVSAEQAALALNGVVGATSGQLLAVPGAAGTTTGGTTTDGEGEEGEEHSGGND